MSRCIHARNGQRVERLARLPSPPRIIRTVNHQPPSVRMGSRWKALPVEGAGRRPIFSRLFQR